MANLIILRGYPGSGKTTLGKKLASLGAGTLVDHNSIYAAVVAITDDDNGIYQEIHKLEVAMTKKLLHEGKNVIIGRGFGKAQAIQPYINLCNELGAKAFTFTLQAPTDLLKQRVTSPERRNHANRTTTPDALMSWVGNHPMQTIPGEITLDATKTIEELSTIIRQTVEQ